MIDDADGNTKSVVYLPHPNGVPSREIVVHGHHVNASPRERVEVCGKCRDQRFSFSGAHLGDIAIVQYHAAQKLHVEVPLPQGTTRGLPHGGKRFGREIVKRTASASWRIEAPPELVFFCSQRFVRKRFRRILKCIYARNDWFGAF